VARSVTYSVLKRKGLALPEVEESTSYGTPALKVRGKLMARLKEDDETVVLRTTWEERERLMMLYPTVFFVTEHYRNHPWVLMRLSTVTSLLLGQVLESAWRFSAPRSLLASRSSNPKS
jgi:hypothetical protein